MATHDQDQSAPLDVAAVLEAIRREVRERRRQTAVGAEPTFPEVELRQLLQEIEAARVVSTHWPLQGRSLPQRAIAFINKLVRRYLRWYINPIVDQQNAYNDVVARTLQGLLAANEELHGQVAQLRVQVGQLEAALQERAAVAGRED